MIYDKPSIVIDGNVNRIITRYYNFTKEIKLIKREVKKKAVLWLPNNRYSNYTSAIIDFGAVICTPKNPSCSTCPLNKNCKSNLLNTTNKVPNIKKINKKDVYWTVFYIYNKNGDILIKKNEEKKLYFGFIEYPWIISKNPVKKTNNTEFSLTHKLTHLNLYLRVKIIYLNETKKINSFINSKNNLFKNSIFININHINKYPMSTLFKKIYYKGIKYM